MEGVLEVCVCVCKKDREGMAGGWGQGEDERLLASVCLCRLRQL